MIRRNILENILQAIADTPVILLNGPRQSGKSTLMEGLKKRLDSIDYFTLDDATTLEIVKRDPQLFLSQQPTDHIIIDEVQKAPDLLPAIKLLVDRDRRPGRFLLTGSADILLLPKISESLAGRSEILTLYPLSVGELKNKKETFIDRAYHGKFESLPTDLDELKILIHQGGFPEVISRKNDSRKRNWFYSYIETILQRDVQSLARIEGLTKLPHLLRLIATRPGAILRYEELSNTSDLPSTTLKRYLTLLETFFLTHTLPPWSSHKGKRLVKSPKLYINDTGLLSYLLDLNSKSLNPLSSEWGKLVETFVINEIKKIASWTEPRPRLYYFRTQDKKEVDLVIQSAEQKIIGIEIKASKTLHKNDFNPMHQLKESTGHLFHQGIILYLGDQVLPFGPDMYAIPISNLWQ